MMADDDESPHNSYRVKLCATRNPLCSVSETAVGSSLMVNMRPSKLGAHADYLFQTAFLSKNGTGCKPDVKKSDAVPRQDAKQQNDNHHSNEATFNSMTNYPFIFGQGLSKRVVIATSKNDATCGSLGAVESDNKQHSFTFPSTCSGFPIAEKQNTIFTATDSDDTFTDFYNSTKSSYKAIECMPDASSIELKTGEEDDVTVLQLHCRIHYYNNSESRWVQKGSGYVRVNDRKASPNDPFRSRLIARASGSLKVFFNSRFFYEMMVKIAENETKVMLSVLGMTGLPVLYLLTFSSGVEANDFFQHVYRRLERLRLSNRHKSKPVKQSRLPVVSSTASNSDETNSSAIEEKAHSISTAAESTVVIQTATESTPSITVDVASPTADSAEQFNLPADSSSAITDMKFSGTHAPELPRHTANITKATESVPLATTDGAIPISGSDTHMDNVSSLKSYQCHRKRPVEASCDSDLKDLGNEFLASSPKKLADT